MTKLFTQNAKLAASSTHAVLAVNFGIPALRSTTGLTTCPMAGACARGCYAQQGAYVWPAVSAAYEWRLARTLLPTFAAEANADLAVLQRRATKQGKRLVVRLHDAGDFYSAAYVNKWTSICMANPDVTFYAYTKQVLLWQAMRKQGSVPFNLRIIFSEGGKADGRIDVGRDFHSRVFPDLEALRAAGYADASHDDMVAALGTNHRVGLIYHGAKGKAWRTDAAA